MNPLLIHLRNQWAGVLALLLVLTGGTAYAAHHAKLPKNSVASKQVKNNTIQGKDIRDGSMTAADLAAGTVPSITSFATTMPVDGQFRDVRTFPTWGTLQARCTVGTVALKFVPQGGSQLAEWIRLESAGSEFSDSRVVSDQTPVSVASTIDFGDSRLFVQRTDSVLDVTISIVQSAACDSRGTAVQTSSPGTLFARAATR